MLVFAAGAQRLLNVNDFGKGTRFQQLRIEGTTAGAGWVGVESTTSSGGGYSGQGFAFKIQVDGFTAPTCTVTVHGINAPDVTVGIPNCSS